MRDKHRITAFYLEMLILVAVFTGVILVLADVFAAAKERTNQAKLLTSAVGLAENSAELVASAGGPMELFRRLDQEGNVDWIQEGGSLRAKYNVQMEPDRDGALWVEMDWAEQDGLARYGIRVLWQEEPVYQMETAVYRGRAAS